MTVYQQETAITGVLASLAFVFVLSTIELQYKETDTMVTTTVQPKRTILTNTRHKETLQQEVQAAIKRRLEQSNKENRDEQNEQTEIITEERLEMEATTRKQPSRRAKGKRKLPRSLRPPPSVATRSEDSSQDEEAYEEERSFGSKRKRLESSMKQHHKRMETEKHPPPEKTKKNTLDKEEKKREQEQEEEIRKETKTILSKGSNLDDAMLVLIACTKTTSSYWEEAFTFFFVVVMQAEMHPIAFLKEHEKPTCDMERLMKKKWEIQQYTTLPGPVKNRLQSTVDEVLDEWETRTKPMSERYKFVGKDRKKTAMLLKLSGTEVKEEVTATVFKNAREFRHAALNLENSHPESHLRDCSDDILFWMVEHLQGCRNKGEFKKAWTAQYNVWVEEKQAAFLRDGGSQVLLDISLGMSKEEAKKRAKAKEGSEDQNEDDDSEDDDIDDEDTDSKDKDDDAIKKKAETDRIAAAKKKAVAKKKAAEAKKKEEAAAKKKADETKKKAEDDETEKANKKKVEREAMSVDSSLGYSGLQDCCQLCGEDQPLNPILEYKCCGQKAHLHCSFYRFFLNQPPAGSDMTCLLCGGGIREADVFLKDRLVDRVEFGSDCCNTMASLGVKFEDWVSEEDSERKPPPVGEVLIGNSNDSCCDGDSDIEDIEAEIEAIRYKPPPLTERESKVQAVLQEKVHALLREESDHTLIVLLDQFRQYTKEKDPRKYTTVLCALLSTPQEIWHKYHGKGDLSPPKVLSGRTRKGQSNIQPHGKEFPVFAQDIIKVLDTFFTQCKYAGCLPDRWNWETKLGILLDTVEREKKKTRCVGFREFAMLVCLVLSSASKDASCIIGTTALHEAGLLCPFKIAKMAVADLAKIIQPAGLQFKKAKHLIAICIVLVERYNGEVPMTFQGLTDLLGVGAKTALLLLNEAFNKSEGEWPKSKYRLFVSIFSFHSYQFLF